jgi:hypothetical protein
MKLRARICCLIILVLSVTFSGCRSSSPEPKPITAEKPPVDGGPAGAPSITSERPNWKIPPRPSDEMKPLAPLEDITKLFRAAYASARAEFQHSQGTVVLTRLSGATLFRNGKIVETVRVIPAEYHNLRYSAHVPFMIFLKLHSRCGVPLDAPTRADVEKYITTIQQAEPALAYTKLTHPTLETAQDSG